jgi:hypothetical protein
MVGADFVVREKYCWLAGVRRWLVLIFPESKILLAAAG